MKLYKRTEQDRGFTVLELLVIFIIISTMTAVAIPAFKGHQRSAAIATLKNDISSSIPMTVNTMGGDAAFVTAEDFVRTAAMTSPNNLVLFVSGSGGGEVACIWGSRVFSEDDIVSFHYSTVTGRMGDGGCVGTDPENTTVVVGTGPDTDDPDTPEDEGSDPNNPASPGDPWWHEWIPGGGNPTTPTTPTTPGSGTPPIVPPGQGGENPGNGNPGGPNQPSDPVIVPAGPSNPPPVVNNDKNKYPVCHSSEANKWNLLMLPLPAITFQGHDIHDDDVIPPILGHYPGKRWNAEGWVIFIEHCT